MENEYEAEKLVNLFASSSPANPFVALLRLSERREDIVGMFSKFSLGIAIARKNPDLIPGDVGYDEALTRDADEMQLHFDNWWRHARRCVGIKVLTNYGVAVKNGDFSRAMKRYGYLIFLSQDGFEAENKDVHAVVHKHSQKFGNQGCGAGSKKQTKADALGRQAMRKLAYLTGLNVKIRKEHEKKKAEEADTPRNLRFAENRCAYKRGPGEKEKIDKKRQKADAAVSKAVAKLTTRRPFTGMDITNTPAAAS